MELLNFPQIVFLLASIFLLSSFAEAKDCSPYTSCSSCVYASVDCIWCKPKIQIENETNGAICTEGSFTGSSLSEDACSDFYWGQCGVPGMAFGINETYIIIGAIIIFFIILLVFLLICCCCRKCCKKDDDDDDQDKKDYELAEKYSNKKPEESEYDRRRKDMFNNASASENAEPIALSPLSGSSSGTMRSSGASGTMRSAGSNMGTMRTTTTSTEYASVPIAIQVYDRPSTPQYYDTERPPTPPMEDPTLPSYPVNRGYQPPAEEPTPAYPVHQYEPPAEDPSLPAYPVHQYQPPSTPPEESSPLQSPPSYNTFRTSVYEEKPPTPPNEDMPPSYSGFRANQDLSDDVSPPPEESMPPPPEEDDAPSYRLSMHHTMTDFDRNRGSTDFSDIEKTLANLQMELGDK